MRAKIQKWGNSLALRIPKPFAKETSLGENSAVEVTVRKGTLVVTAISRPDLSLEDLVSRITAKNRHGETEMGEAVGREFW